MEVALEVSPNGSNRHSHRQLCGVDASLLHPLSPVLDTYWFMNAQYFAVINLKLKSSYPQGRDDVGRSNNVLLATGPGLHAKTQQQEVQRLEASEFLAFKGYIQH